MVHPVDKTRKFSLSKNKNLVELNDGDWLLAG